MMILIGVLYHIFTYVYNIYIYTYIYIYVYHISSFLNGGTETLNHPSKVRLFHCKPSNARRTVILAASVRKAEIFWALVVGLFSHVKWRRFETSNPKPKTHGFLFFFYIFFLNHGFRAVLGLDRWVRNGQYHTYTKVVNF